MFHHGEHEGREERGKPETHARKAVYVSAWVCGYRSVRRRRRAGFRIDLTHAHTHVLIRSDIAGCRLRPAAAGTTACHGKAHGTCKSS